MKKILQFPELLLLIAILRYCCCRFHACPIVVLGSGDGGACQEARAGFRPRILNRYVLFLLLPGMYRQPAPAYQNS